MTRSSEFDAAVKHGVRAVQPDMVIHARRGIGEDNCGDDITGPRVGLIIAKSVGSAVERHRVARRLRHVVRTLLDDLGRSEQVVIRALPSSRQAPSARLEPQLRTGLRRVHESMGSKR
jgi:ribonuclease P protein component